MIDRSTIISLTDHGLAVFRHYLGDVRPGKRFHSPLYHDTQPSCSIYYDKRRGVYRFKDFGNEELSGDCFWLVGVLHHLDCNNPADFRQILNIIDQDLHLGLSTYLDAKRPSVPIKIPKASPPPRPVHIPRPFSFTAKAFTAKDLAYWQQYGITPQTLESYGVVSVRSFESTNQDGQPYRFIATPEQPMYGYTGPESRYIKIYRPFSNLRFVFGGDYGDYYRFGFDQLIPTDERVFITGGEKDVMALAARGFQAVCFGSETVFIPTEAIKQLAQRFPRITLLYDCDRTGQRSARTHQQRLAAYRVERIDLPLAGTKQEKDIADYFRLGYDREDFLQLKSQPVLHKSRHL